MNQKNLPPATMKMFFSTPFSELMRTPVHYQCSNADPLALPMRTPVHYHCGPPCITNARPPGIQTEPMPDPWHSKSPFVSECLTSYIHQCSNVYIHTFTNVAMFTFIHSPMFDHLKPLIIFTFSSIYF